MLPPNLQNFLKIGSKARGIVIAQLGNHGRALRSVLVRVVGHHGSLEGIDKANAEVVVVALGYLGVGAGAADGRDFAVREDLSGRYGHAGAVAAEHHADLFAHQLVGGVYSLGFVGFIIYLHQL